MVVRKTKNAMHRRHELGVVEMEPIKKNPATEQKSYSRVGGLGGQEDESHRDLIEGLRKMPYLDPPPELLSSVMRGVRSRRLPWWRRLQRWASAPRSVVFTPLQLAPLAAVVLAFCTLAIYQSLQQRPAQISQVISSSTQPVTLTLTMPNVKSASVIGSFNDWRSQGYEMSWSEQEGAWIVVLRLPKGRYEYAFVVDDEIIPDPGAGVYQEDGFGNRNAVLMVGNGHEKQI